MFSKLSLRNAKRQARDYLVYFITIVISAALIYAFNGLVFSNEIKDLAAVLEYLPLLIFLASVVVVAIIGWLVAYTVRFMLAKRSRELGTYILLGMENSQVAQLFFLENLAVGGVAILIGLLFGNLLFQALRAITLALFQAPYTFSFSFSIGGILLTLLYFTLIYLFALFKSRKRIRNMNIHDLIYLEKKNEEEAIKQGKNRKKLFITSIITGICGMLLLFSGSAFTGIIGAGFLIFFMYSFFFSFSSGVPDYFNQRPDKKYNGKSLLIFRSLSSKLSTMGIVMATIGVLFTATLIAEGSGLVFQTIFHSRAEQNSCFDLTVSTPSKDAKQLDVYKAYIDKHIPTKKEHDYAIYQGDNKQVMDYISNKTDYVSLNEHDTLMAYSDYAKLREIIGLKPAKPLKDNYLIHSMKYIKNQLAAYTKSISVGGVKLPASGQVYSEPFSQSYQGVNGIGYILVVPDPVLKNQPVTNTNYIVMTKKPVTEADYNELYSIRNEKEQATGNFESFASKTQTIAENASMQAMIVFPLYYIALVLTMVAATILTIQLLSETDRYRHQYKLLDNLGMDRKEMRKTLTRQFLLFYSLPVVPSWVISVPFILYLGNATDADVMDYGVWQNLGIVGFTLLLFLFIYLVYILSAYTSFKRSVLPD